MGSAKGVLRQILYGTKLLFKKQNKSELRKTYNTLRLSCVQIIRFFKCSENAGCGSIFVKYTVSRKKLDIFAVTSPNVDRFDHWTQQ